MQIAYWALLFGLATLALADGTPALRRGVFALLGCGVASLIFASVIEWTGDTYTFAMMIVDGIAAFVILAPPAGLFQALIGATYLTQIALHAAKVINGISTDLNGYWWGLTIMALLQLALIGGWWAYERRYRGAHLHGAVAPARSANRSRDGG